jgi:tRNA(His) guanylyltransferase
MKDCEIFSNLRVPCGSKIVVRADGRNFSKLSNKLNLEKPYDHDFTSLICEVCSDFFSEFSPKFIYTFSDEINILLSDIPFNGRIEKLDSVFAGFISGSFMKHLMKDENFLKVVEEDDMKPVSFDSRIIPLSDIGTVEYFQNRQNEAWRNCLNGYSYWKLRENHDKISAVEILNKKKGKELHNLLFENGLNINDVPTWQRRGIGLYKTSKEVKGYNPLNNTSVISNRNTLKIDYELPIINQDFFQKQIFISTGSDSK